MPKSTKAKKVTKVARVTNVAPATTATKSSSLTLDELVAQAITLLDQVASMVKVSGSALTKANRKKAVKMRTGGEKYVPVIASLAERFTVNVGGYSSTTMKGKLQQAQSLAPLLKRAQLLTTQLNDASLQANAQAWDSAMVLYSTLRRISRANADVQATLAPVQAFFARRAAAAGTTPTTGKGATTAAATSSAPATPPSATTATPTPHA